MKLQNQAKDSNIPDDIPVLKKLNQSIQRFDKFKRQCNEYYRFRENIKKKGANLLSNASLTNQQRMLQRSQERQKLGGVNQIESTSNISNLDSKFNRHFLQKLINEIDDIDIEIPSEYFNKE